MAAQFVDYLLTTADRADAYVAATVGSIVETDPPHVTERARCYHGPDSHGLLRSRCEPRKRQADAQFMVADVESGERPAAGPAADERLDSEGPELARTTDRELAGIGSSISDQRRANRGSRQCRPATGRRMLLATPPVETTENTANSLPALISRVATWLS
jgi:hypothetical protein